MIQEQGLCQNLAGNWDFVAGNWDFVKNQAGNWDLIPPSGPSLQITVQRPLDNGPTFLVRIRDRLLEYRRKNGKELRLAHDEG